MSEEQPTYGGNAYTLGYVNSESEIARQKAFTYPNRVSQEALFIVKDKIVLDLGAGAGTELGRWVVAEGGHYVALDQSAEFLTEHRRAGFATVCGDVTSLPADLPQADVAHMRFVLMHLRPDLREHAIREAIHIAREKVVFLELNWRPFMSRHSKGGEPVTALDRFVNFTFMATPVAVNLLSGMTLQEEVAEIVHAGTYAAQATVRGKTHARPFGNYYHEFIPVARMIVKTANEAVKRGRYGSQNALRFNHLLAELEADAASEDPPAFRPPDIDVIIVSKARPS